MPNPFERHEEALEAEEKVQQERRAEHRNMYGVPVFLGAWIGAIAQDLAIRFPGYGFIAFITAVVLLGLLVKACNSR